MKKLRTLRAHAARIWNSALEAVEPERAVRGHLRRHGNQLHVGKHRIDLREVRSVWAIGAGKAAAPMGRALESVLGQALTGGILVTKYGHGLPLETLELLEAGHPLPDAGGIRAGRKIIEFVESKVGPKDLVFCLLSGGGSALLVAPAEDIPWKDKQSCTQLLLKAGATIHEMNALRKHLSILKGGGLARLVAPTPAVSLILSDVVGDDLDTIASGPMVPDTTTFRDCLAILERLEIYRRVPKSILRRLEAGASGKIPETPKPGDRFFRRNLNVIVASNSQACTAAAREAKRLGYNTLVLTSRMEGDTREGARFHMNVVQEIVHEGRPVKRPACILSGGETTVRIRGEGKGGRNQEFALHCAEPLERLPAPCAVASLGTDGTDGPTDAAGAIADNETASRARKVDPRLLHNAAANNDSYTFFGKLDDLIMTGPTRTNVMDLHILLVS